MTERGFIALARGMLDHPIVGIDSRRAFSRTEAWQWLLFEAAYKPRRYQAGNAVIELERGQLAHSIRYMAKAWRWPESKVRRFLERLKTGAGTGAMIGAETGAGITVITICNYERYQTPPHESGAAPDAPTGAASDAKVAQQRRRKEQGNKETIDSSRSRAREPEGFAEWYGLYPRKKQRKDAARAFGKLMKAGEISLAELIVRTRAFAAAESAKPEAERRFIPYPASWLNAGGYLDEPDTSAAKHNSGDLKIVAPTRNARNFTEAEWRDRLATFKSTGRWPKEYWGPPPGSPNCLLPPSLAASVAT